MGWLCGRFALATVFGAIGGPLAYLAGDKLGALEIHVLPAVVIAWIVVMPCLLAIEMKTRPRRLSAPGELGKTERPNTPGART